MTIHLPEDLERYVQSQVQLGRFASTDEALTEAVRLLQQRLPEPSGPAPRSADELSDQELQRRLFAAGLVSEIKPPLTDLTPYRHRQAVTIQGEPLSATSLRERR